MNRIEFREGFKRLSDFFGKSLKEDQLTVYYDKLKGFDNDIMMEAIETLIESDRTMFPPMGPILQAFREKRYQRLKGGRQEKEEVRGCLKCIDGAVIYYRNGYEYALNCAICHKGQEQGRFHSAVQIDEQILPAFHRRGRNYVADPDDRKAPLVGAVPKYTNLRLQEISTSPLLGTMSPQARAELFARYPVRGVTLPFLGGQADGRS
jgi:hypothetical protein